MILYGFPLEVFVLSIKRKKTIYKAPKHYNIVRGDRGTLGQVVGYNGQWVSWETAYGRILKILSHDLRYIPAAILFSQCVAGSTLNVRDVIIFVI